MSGSGFLRGLNEAKGREVVQLMKERFPEDMAFYAPEGIPRVVMWPGVNDTGSDLFYVIFASKGIAQIREISGQECHDSVREHTLPSMIPKAKSRQVI